jgi:hypothetical protein
LVAAAARHVDLPYTGSVTEPFDLAMVVSVGEMTARNYWTALYSPLGNASDFV